MNLRIHQANPHLHSTNLRKEILTCESMKEEFSQIFHFLLIFISKIQDVFKENLNSKDKTLS